MSPYSCFKLSLTFILYLLAAKLLLTSSHGLILCLYERLTTEVYISLVNLVLEVSAFAAIATSSRRRKLCKDTCPEA